MISQFENCLIQITPNITLPIHDEIFFKNDIFIKVDEDHDI